MLRVALLTVFVLLVGAVDDHYCQSEMPAYIHLPDLKLEYVQTITRHGARTQLYMNPAIEQPQAVWNCKLNQLERPSQEDSNTDQTRRLFRKTYRKDVEYLKGNCNFGQLTDVGYQQHYELGRAFRKIYVDKQDLFEGKVDMAKVSVRSTDVYRTIQSAEAGLTGMFTEGEINTANGVEVVEVQTTDNGLEDMTPNGALCPLFNTEVHRLHESSEWKNQEKSLEPLKAKLMSAFDVEKLPPWDGMYDIYQLRSCRGIANPPEITDEIFDQIRMAAEWEVNITAVDPGVARPGMGLFMKTISDNIMNYVKGNHSIKYQLFSGHDSTVAPLLGLLGLFDGRWPPFASHVNFELYKNKTSTNRPATMDDWFVQIKSNGKIFTLPGCTSSACPLKTVMGFFATKIITKEQCGAASAFKRTVVGQKL